MAELDDPKRLSHFHGALIAQTADEELQACVAEAALRAEAPTATLTFVMARVQYFRAAVGLPPDLTISRGTNRCDSFCQFIVRDEKPFIVRDAPNDPRVPKTLVELYGIGAYLGVPLFLGSEVLGSLCVIDSKPRDWSTGAMQALTELSERATKRLLELTAEVSEGVPPLSLRELAGATALADDLVLDAQALERSLVEVSPFIRLAQALLNAELPADTFARGTSVLREAADLFDDMLGVSRDLSRKSECLSRFLVEKAPKAET